MDRCAASRRWCRSASGPFRRSRWPTTHGRGRGGDRRGARRRGGQCAALVPWRGPAQNPDGHPTFTSYSFYDLFYSQQQIIEGQKPGVDPAVFKDRIVIVGGSGGGIEGSVHDAVPGRRDRRPGSARQRDRCVAVESFDRAARPAGSTVAMTIAARPVVGVAGLYLNAWLTGAVAAGARARCWRGNRVAFFATRHLWLPVTVPGLAIVFAFVGDLAWKYVVEGREKRQVKKLFSRYVSKDVYDQLVADPSLAALGGARRTHDRAVLRHARLHGDVREGHARRGRRRS